MRIFVSQGSLGWAQKDGQACECLFVTLRTSYSDLPGGHEVVMGMSTDIDRNIPSLEKLPSEVALHVQRKIKKTIAASMVKEPFAIIEPLVFMHNSLVYIVARDEAQAAKVAQSKGIRSQEGSTYPGSPWLSVLASSGSRPH